MQNQIQLELPDLRYEYELWMKKKKEEEEKKSKETVIIIDLY